MATVIKDLARWRDDPTTLLIWLAIPLLIGGLLTSMMDGDNAGPSGTLLIADLDDTLVSGFVAGAYSQDQLGEILDVLAVSADEGAALIAAGGASGFLTIPAGFQSALLNNEAVTLTLVTNPSQTIIPGIIGNVTELLLDAGFYLQALFGPEIEAIQQADIPDAPSDLFVSDLAVQINQKMEQFGPMLFPPAIELEIVEPPPAEPRPDFALLFLPGIVMMALLFTAQGLSSDFWKERELGTLRRLVATPGRLNEFVFGKALAAAVILGAIAAITMALGFWYHVVSWAKFLPSLLWVTVAGVGLFAWFAALQMLFPSNKAANLLTTIIVFPLLMMGGSFFPLEALPDWLAAIGRLSPNGFVVDRMSMQLTGAAAWSYDARAWLTIIAMAASGLLLCVWRLSSGFARR